MKNLYECSFKYGSPDTMLVEAKSKRFAIMLFTNFRGVSEKEPVKVTLIDKQR